MLCFFIFIYIEILSINMNGEIIELGGMNINEFAIKFKDLSARELIQEIINAITLNNSAIGSRINDLNDRLEAIERNYVSVEDSGNQGNQGSQGSQGSQGNQGSL